jgi:hypothetical protein
MSQGMIRERVNQISCVLTAYDAVEYQNNHKVGLQIQKCEAADGNAGGENQRENYDDSFVC